MRTELDCIPCLVRQALDAARFSVREEAAQRRILAEALTMLAADADQHRSPPQAAQRIHRLVRRASGHDDPYAALKRRSTAVALAALPRLRVADEAGVLARVATILADAGISIDALLQREADEVGGEGSTQTDLIILTHEAREGAMNGALAQLQALPTVLAPIVRIRKEELN